MHRLPLFLLCPSKIWNRSSAEYSLFKIALNTGNVMEMRKMIAMLDVESRRQTVLEMNIATSFVQASEELMGDKTFILDKHNFDDVMNMLRVAILRAPRDCPALKSAFFLRGKAYFQKFVQDGGATPQKYILACINDLTFYLDVRDPCRDAEELLAVVHGMLTVCFYFLKEDHKAVRHIALYNSLKEKLYTELRSDLDFAVIDHHIRQLDNELQKSKQLAPKYSGVVNCKYPFQGFNLNPDIPLTSYACFYASSDDVYHQSGDMSPHLGVFAKTAIPQDSTVLMEDPFVSELATPYIQCEVCFSCPLEVYSCLECRYKTYCSLDCMTADSMHRHECAALKDLMLLILDARSLFGVFVRLSRVLKERVFSQRSFKKMDCISVFKHIEEFDDISSQTVRAQYMYINFMKKMPQYNKLSEMQYSTLVATALRLTVYIERKTDFIPKYYGSLNLSDKNTLILIGAILMRIQGHLLVNTFDFDLKLPLGGANEPSEVKLRTLRPYKDGIVNDVNKFYKVNEANELRKYQQKLAEKSKNVPSNKLPEEGHIKPCNKIARIVSCYKDHIAELYFSTDQVDFILYGEGSGLPLGRTLAQELCRRINDMVDAERLSFAQAFVSMFHAHLTDFFINHRIRHNVKRQTLCIYSSSLAKFAHSCDPSVTIIVLDNGTLLGKTIRDIDPHEELTVSYKANHIIHARKERRQFLENLGIWCRCSKCTDPIGKEVTEMRCGIYCKCERTNFYITPAMGKCPSCSTSYLVLLKKYKQELLNLDGEIKDFESKPPAEETSPNIYDAEERELYMLYKSRYKHARRAFAPGHEFRVKGELMYAKFLARKNFSQQAFHVIMELKDGLVELYDGIWFTYFEELLGIIKLILAINVDEGLTAISSTSLLELCRLGGYIVQEQKKHALIYDIWDSKCISIEDNRRSLKLWEEQIVRNNALPLPDSLRACKALALDAQKEHVEMSPPLSKSRY